MGNQVCRCEALLLEGKMKDEKKTCSTCSYLEELPFSDEYLCGNPNSEYADCPCSKDDTCEEWCGKDEE